MSGAGISIYIRTKPKRWRITQTYKALNALKRLSEFSKLGYVPYGIHDSIGTRTNFVLHILFANQEEKVAYEQHHAYAHFLSKVRRYSKRGGFTLS